jgi:CheY-like chemotaxis protein
MSRLLVVDDELGMRETLTDILETAGHKVDVAANGLLALDRLAVEDYDVVVMDVRMPELDGVSVLQRMGPPPPQVILMTAYALDEQLAQAVDADAFAVVQKPFPVRMLLQLVERAVVAA